MKRFFLTLNIILFLSFTGIPVFTQDKTPPVKPEITYVTVDTSNNNVTIYWTKSPSPDVARYILYYEVKTANGYEGVKFDSVPVPVTSYTDNTTGLAGTKSLMYSISAVDSSGNESTRKPGLHSTIHNTVSYDSCSSTLTLRWNKYMGWGNNVSGYRVNERISNGSYHTIAGIDARDSSFIIYDVPENTQYNFFIEGVKNDSLVSNSNIASKYTYMPDAPTDMLLDYVSVTGNETVELKFRFSVPTAITDFALLRSNQEFSAFKRIKSFHQVSTSPLTIEDSIFTSVNSFFYRIGALNTCGNVIDTSNLGSNILLTGLPEGDTNTLEWNTYRDFPLGTQFYEIYRSDTSGSSVLLNTVTDQTSYTDDLHPVFGQNYSGKIIYQVRAVENGGANFSLSNPCEVKVKSDIWMPNAFTPNGDGKNDVFLPYLSFIPTDYLMLIYDRYGIVIFSSEEPGKGWDGRINGSKMAPEGVYVYHVQYSSYNGQKLNKTGHVSLFYPR